MKIPIYHIYLILFPNGAKYIGQTTNLKDRKRRYKKHDCEEQKKLYNHLNKYTFAKCKFYLLEDVLDIDKLDEREIFWIKKFDSFGGDNRKFGLNLTRGGGGARGVKWTEERKQQASERFSGVNNPNYGNKYSIELRKQMSESMKGRIPHFLGKKHTPETIAKIKESVKGRIPRPAGWKMTDDQKLRLSESKSSLILDTFTGIYYTGLKEAAKALSYNPNTLKGWLYGKFKNGKNKSNLIYV